MNKYILDKELLEKRLKELAETPYTGEISSGAMCYCPRAPEDSEYKCLLCKKITVYKSGEFAIKNLKKARAIVKRLAESGYDVKLDEREYCDSCKGEEYISNPRPTLSIKFRIDDDYHTTRVDIEHLEYLETFLQGGDNLLDYYDYTVKLHDNIDILSKITGLGEITARDWLEKVTDSQGKQYEMVKWRLERENFNTEIFDE